MKTNPTTPLASALLGLLLTAVLSVHAQLCTPAPTNIVAWWPGDGHAYDIINAKAAVLQNGVDYAPGEVCQTFRFNADTEKVRIAESAKTDISRTNRWTIEAWVRPSSFVNSSHPTVYSEGNKIAWLGLNSAGNLESWINNNSGTRLVGTNPLTLNVWNHVALVRDGNDRSLYVNGVLAGATNNTPSTTADSTGSAIGHVTTTETLSAFQGEIDEVSLYMGAFDTNQIAAIYNAGPGGKCYSTTNPAFVIQPESQTNYLGAEATFTGLAKGSPCPTYQWWFRATGQPESAALAGRTDYTLTLTNLTFANDGDYTVVVNSGSSAATSAVARLTVKFCEDTPPGLLAWWPGDGSGLEVSSNHNGAVWGGTTYASGVAGKALNFNGTDAYVAVPDSAKLSPHVGNSGQMSVEAWVFLTALPASDPYTGQDRRTVLGKGDSGRWEYTLSISTTGVAQFHSYAAGGSGAGYSSAIGGLVILNQWTHLVGILKKGQFIRLYQNGQLVAESTTVTNTTSDTGSPFYIGRRGDGQFFNGRVDEVALYNRALDAGEIATLYASGAFGKCAGAGNPAPFFAVQPMSQSGYFFLNAGLAGLALGTPRPDYQWYRSNSPTTWAAIARATNATLSFTNLTGNEQGFYRVSASNRYGAVESRPVRLTVVAHSLMTGGDSFELGWNGWTSDNYSIWQVGVPTIGPARAHSGASVLATVLGGNYPRYTDSRAISPPFVVPAAGENPRLRFWHWFNTWGNGDYGCVEVKEVGASTWIKTSPNYDDYSGAWTYALIDLKAYAGKTIQIAFHFVDDGGDTGWSAYTPTLSSGWYIDEVKVETGAWTFNSPESFESGMGGWAPERGVWETGNPTSGPGAAHAGSRCLATVLGENYPRYTDSRVISPPFVVPAAGENPRLRFWHWFSTWGDGDYGCVEVRQAGATTWTKISPSYDDYSGAWTYALLDLKAYAGRTVQIAFHFVDDGGDTGWSAYTPTLNPGWYVDEVQVVTGAGVFNNPEGFESGMGDWAAERGVWEVGTNSGGDRAYRGNKCLGTVWNGNYPRYTDSRAISPPFVVPAAGENPRLRFWHWFSTWGDGDYGCVEVRQVGATAWTKISPNYDDYGGAWTCALLDLKAYAGRTVQVAFHFVDDGGDTGWSAYTPTLNPGWYVDEVQVVTGAWVFNNPEGFEGGTGDWAAERGVWEVGNPTSGPGAARVGSKSLATVLDGNYPRYADSRAISPPLVVPPAQENPRLVFSHWISTWNDKGFVEVKEVGSSSWVKASSDFTTTGGLWTDASVNLSAFAGKIVQIAFRFVDDGGDTGWSAYTPTLSAGWYVDGVFIQSGNVALTAIPDKTIAETGCVTFTVPIVGANTDSILSFSLGTGCPAGARIDPETGVFTWCPTECQGPGVYRIPVYVVDFGNNEANDLTFVKITVNEVNQPPWLLPTSATARVGRVNIINLCSGDEDCPANPLTYTLLGTIPTGLTITSANGMLRWTPTLAQVGSYNLRVRLCDGGSPSYCVTNTLAIGVTANSPYSFTVEPLVSGDLQFTLLDGLTNVSYTLQSTTDLCECPCQSVWQSRGYVSPTEMPYTFIYARTNFSDAERLFFRLDQVPRR